ncbi:MAG TPA: tyrosine--tRNA ligase [Methylomirabilota bacterium]|nr:tyrosine--tRNA ligase [Methylomirabilota bacterium]
MDLWKNLKWRGLIADSTKPHELHQHLLEAPRAAYVGFDPTADSLHVGSLLPLLVLRRVQLAGHRPIVLIGGGTGLIGDPSGKTGERQLNPEQQVTEWAARLKEQVKRFLDFDSGSSAAILDDNYQWLSTLQVIPFLRDIGKHFPLGAMIAKESVRSRMGRSEEGISYTEFSYQVLQAYDFMALFDRYRCTLQLGGSDQWGNITAGIELIRRVRGQATYGITLPLVTKTDGSKFGKTESGTVWLDPKRTSPYEMFQFWLNTGDDEVVPYLKFFTFLEPEEIDHLQAVTHTSPDRREAQRALARHVTALVHGEAATAEAEAISQALFSGEVESLSETHFVQACQTMPTTTLPRQGVAGMPVVELLTRVGLVASKREGRELLSAGAIFINGQKVKSADAAVSPEMPRFGRFILIRKGKKSYHAAILA